MSKIKIIFIDLFCGAGGVTSGIHNSTDSNGENISEVAVCVNHDENAILSHSANHPETLHFVEDIKTVSMVLISNQVDIRRKYWEDKGYTVIIALWASLECTNFSNAKGGVSRDADSRTLAEHLFRYIDSLCPDYIWIENVREFMSWGPLDKNGKPVSKDKGVDYMRWVANVMNHGYNFDHRILNCADYSANTSRKRFFGCFAKYDLPIKFPLPTHSNNPDNGLFSNLKKWRPVKECLDFSDEGKSIFNRKKDLSERSLERIYAGLLKYIAGGKDSFIANYYSEGAQIRDIGIPSASITTVNHSSIVKSKFLTKYHGNGDNILSINDTCSTLTTKDRLALIQPKYILNYHHSSTVNSIEDPSQTLTCKDKFAIVKPKFWLDKQYSGPLNHQSIQVPSGAILSNDKHCLMKANHFINNPAWFGNNGAIDQPCRIIVARQDKAPLYLISMKHSKNVSVPVYDSDSEIMIAIKEFMAIYNIEDIFMRRLKVPELLSIQGFHKNYVLIGTQTDQKKFIGNSVPPPMVKALIEAMHEALIRILSIAP